MVFINNPLKLIRVLVAEDSPTYRELLVNILQDAPGLQVIGTARNGAEAVRLAKRLKPDVITMDIYMPEMDGFEATRQIMTESPCPVVVISASTDRSQNDLSFNALRAGALSVIEKPTLNDPPEVYQALANQVRLMSEVKVVRHWSKSAPPSPSSASSIEPTPPVLLKNDRTHIQIVAIASSTGGPGVLAEILSKLPGDFPSPILIVQHITPGFGVGLADWLNQQTPLEVRLARHADEPKPGQVLIAPDGAHMVYSKRVRVGLFGKTESSRPRGYRVRPDVRCGRFQYRWQWPV